MDFFFWLFVFLYYDASWLFGGDPILGALSEIFEWLAGFSRL